MQTLIMLGFGAVLVTILVWFSNLLFRHAPRPEGSAAANSR
ncbi:hypothetical protein R5W24_002067 [Gemmata sp. JC717]|uniref:Uncharacterized protein n=1 Tax=Gemmata algarum TaxID=2975278 RepID=A0ABU5EZA6_9BACT|nr:hypothetical protein [Gemmata algarum]MDY3552977.1 hypothetical protein [Gemmata algarum]MDY3559138.1 hypothetical protein [Gemmata algarum]